MLVSRLPSWLPVEELLEASSLTVMVPYALGCLLVALDISAVGYSGRVPKIWKVVTSLMLPARL